MIVKFSDWEGASGIIRRACLLNGMGWGGVGWGGMGWAHGAGLHTALIIVLHMRCVNNVHISASFSVMCTSVTLLV